VSTGSGQGAAESFCEVGNETSCSVKGGEFLDWVSDSLTAQEGLCSMESLS
jgi:hypothetical protein